MYIPPVGALRADPVPRSRSAYVNISHQDALPGRIQPLRDQLRLSDESRLREEYGLRLMGDGRRAGDERPASLPTLIDMARVYADFWEDIHLNFHDDPLLLALHIQALDNAWRDTLDSLAQLAAERLAHREGDPRAANVPLLHKWIGKAHRAFADTFCTSRLLCGDDRAMIPAVRDAVRVLTLVADQELSLSDTMALLYYRKGLERLN